MTGTHKDKDEYIRQLEIKFNRLKDRKQEIKDLGRVISSLKYENKILSKDNATLKKTVELQKRKLMDRRLANCVGLQHQYNR